MIIDTGDIHGKPFDRFDIEMFPKQEQMTKNDYVIINGDFGIGFSPKNDEKLIEYLESKNFTTLFCDGNHENFERLNNYPTEIWNGGTIHRISPSIIHLMRGQIYTIDGTKIFVFGGARSHDIKDGILEADDPRIPDWCEDRTKLFRINHINWWEGEFPTEAEMQTGLQNLALHNFEVDYIISHDLPTSALTLYCALYGAHGFYKPDALNDYLEKIRTLTNYKKWLCGHYHENRNVTDKEIILYDDMYYIQY